MDRRPRMPPMPDDLMAGLPVLPETDEVSESVELELQPSEALQSLDALTTSLVLQAEASTTKEQLQQVEARLTSAYRLRAKVVALEIQTDLVTNYRKLPNDLKLELLKMMSAHGALVPREERTNASPFSLVINMPAVQSEAPVVAELKAEEALTVQLPIGR